MKGRELAFSVTTDEERVGEVTGPPRCASEVIV